MARANDGADKFMGYLRIFAPDLYEWACRECRITPERRWRADICFLGTPIAVEIDGGQWVRGGGRHNRDSDREKINTACAMGFRVLRFSTQQVEANPLRCIELIRRALLTERAVFEGACQSA